jgi:hypothetical protein
MEGMESGREALQAVGRLSSAEPPSPSGYRKKKALTPSVRASQRRHSPDYRIPVLLVSASPIVELLPKRIHFTAETDVFLQQFRYALAAIQNRGVVPPIENLPYLGQ